MDDSAKFHLITREIGIDMGHRVTYHGSKCRNLHGHRYTIQATCVGPLFVEGEQQGMVLDFGFLKEEMMSQIDEPCDHGTCLWIDDPFVQSFITLEQLDQATYSLSASGYWLGYGNFGKLYLVPFVPTAENLAKHWFERLSPRVRMRTDGHGWLKQVKVWETPSCSAEYPATELLSVLKLEKDKTNEERV